MFWRHRKLFPENKLLRNFPLLILLVFILVNIVIICFYNGEIGTDKSDQAWYLNYGQQCNEGKIGDGANQITPHYKEVNPNLHFLAPYDLISCTFFKTSFFPLVALRFFNFILYFAMLLLTYMGILIYTRSRKQAIVGFLIMGCSASLWVYQFYILKDTAIVALNSIFLFLLLWMTKKLRNIYIAPFLILINILLIFLFRMQAAIIPLFFAVNFMILHWAHSWTKRTLAYALPIGLLLLIYVIDNNIFEVHLLGKFDPTVFVKYPEHTFRHVQEMFFCMTGFSFLIPHSGVDDSLITWVIKRIVTFDRFVIPFFTFALFIFLNIREKLYFFLLLFPAYFFYQGVWYFQIHFVHANTDFSYRQAMPFFAYYPFLLVQMYTRLYEQSTLFKTYMVRISNSRFMHSLYAMAPGEEGGTKQ